MTQNDLQTLSQQVNDLLKIYNTYSPVKNDGTFAPDSIKPAILEMINYLFSDETEKASLIDWMDKSDFWTAPASTRFHGNYKFGLCLHTLMVIYQSLIFAKPVLESFITSPLAASYTVTAQDIFISALCHDFCKTDFYAIEYRNTKDITGNWVKTPCYKTKGDNRNLGHGNESVLMLLKIIPSYINKRYVLEAVSRHMGFSDLSDSEKYNYSNFLQNPLVVLLQLADETAAQWFNC